MYIRSIFNVQDPVMRPATPPASRRQDARMSQRRAIIEATIDVIAGHGLNGATISRIVARAGIARGMVNLYFRTKDNLLLETVQSLSEEYLQLFSAAIEQSGASAIERIYAYIDADCSEAVLNARKMAVWFAFRAETRSRPEYLAHVETRDPLYEERLTGLFIEAMGKATVEGRRAANFAARALLLLLEGVWADFHLHPATFDREATRKLCQRFVRAAIEQ